MNEVANEPRANRKAMLVACSVSGLVGSLFVALALSIPVGVSFDIIPSDDPLMGGWFTGSWLLILGVVGIILLAFWVSGWSRLHPHPDMVSDREMDQWPSATRSAVSLARTSYDIIIGSNNTSSHEGRKKRAWASERLRAIAGEARSVTSIIEGCDTDSDNITDEQKDLVVMTLWSLEASVDSLYKAAKEDLAKMEADENDKW